MRILFVSFISDNPATGMGKWTYRMRDELETRGHHTAAWFMERFPRLTLYPRLSVLAFPPLLAAELHRARQDFDVAVIHEPSGFWHGLARQLHGGSLPMLSICHNVEPHVFQQLIAAENDGAATVPRASRFKVAIARRWQSLGALRWADHVVCVSAIDRKYLMEEVGVPGERISQISNGVDSSRFSPESDGVRDCRRVIFVGGWLEIKGARLLPAIWRRVRRRVPDAQLTVVGVEHAADEVRRIFAPIGGIEVVPSISDESEMAALYRRHGLLLLPSLTESTPLSVLEAMASGLAVVATRAGGIPDIVEDGKSGLLFPLGDVVLAADAVLRIMTDQALARALSRAAIERAHVFNWSRAGAALENACFAAVSRKRRL